MRDGYPQCPCPTCQEPLGPFDGPRKPCQHGNVFDEDGNVNTAMEDRAK